MSLHVVQLGPVPPPEGGVSRNIQAIRQELALRGHRCSIVATSRSSQVRSDEDVYRPNNPIDLNRQVRDLKPDLLHLHLGGALTPRVMALALACSTLAKTRVLTVHSGEYPRTAAARRAASRSIHGMIFRRFSGVIAINQEIADVFARAGVARSRVSEISPIVLEQ